jgi:preprotein translocase subunit SecG
MGILYYLFAVLMFVDCVLLVFLVLLQLPKKEAGAGMAFGGAATDALFGAGSGNVLTKITKYVAGIFFGLAILMAWMTAHKPESSASALEKSLTQGGGASVSPATPPQTAPATAPASGDGGFLQVPTAPPTGSSNDVTAAPPASNSPAAAPVNTNK